MVKILRIALLIINLLVALTAIGGGIALLAGLESTERVPPEWLHGTPFRNYVIPGLILTIIVGGSATIATYATYQNLNAGGVSSILAGALLMGFIAVEVAILNQPSRWTVTEIVYFITGFTMTVLGFLAFKA